MKRLFTFAAALIAALIVMAGFVQPTSTVKADEDNVGGYPIYCEVQTAPGLPSVTYCFYVLPNGDLVPVAQAPDCESIFYSQNVAYGWTDTYFTYDCKSIVAPEIPFSVQYWMQDAEKGDKMSYANVSWEIEETTLVAYDPKGPEDEKVSLNIRRWNLSDLAKIESTDVPRIK